MFTNYLSLACRSLLHHRIFSIIHVVGLSIGISAALMVYLIVRYEESFDQFEPGHGSVYRVVMDMRFNGDMGYGAAVPAPLAEAVENDLTGLDLVVPVLTLPRDGAADVTPEDQQDEKKFKGQTQILITTPQYFSMVPHRWIAGDAETALAEPFKVVLTSARAQQYFPDTDARNVVGKEIHYAQDHDEFTAVVTGVVDIPESPTDLGALEFVSYSTIVKTNLKDQYMMDNWRDWMAYTKLYLKLSPSIASRDVTTQLNALLQKYNPDAVRDENNYIRFALQPLNDIHFNTQYQSFGQRTASKSVLSTLTAVAGFILLLGCINFTNLSTAKGSQRAREIGIRKTAGGSRKQLILQLLTETFITTLCSSILSVALAPLFLSMFADFLPPGLQFDVLQDWRFLSFILLLTISVSILAGAYPAFVLSGYRPASVLKNFSYTGGNTRRATVRKILTITQFSIAQIFVVVAFIVGKQIHFALSEDPGFRKEAIINFSIPRDTILSHHEALFTAIRTIPSVESACSGFMAPMMQGAAFSNLSYNDGTNELKTNVQVRFGDPEYIDLYKIKIIAGRNVTGGEHVSEVLVNESFAKALGFTNPHDVIGKELSNQQGEKLPVVGVMGDFHLGSYHSTIGPVVFQSRQYGTTAHVALQQHTRTEDWQKAISKIQVAFHRIYPETAFEYAFLDQKLAALYEHEQKTSKLLNVAMALSILISALGLLGLVMFTSSMKTKEIGIRKILGASVSSIVSRLSLEFVHLVLIAFVIAAPLSIWISDRWLQSFAYRTAISWWIFPLTGGFMLIVAIVTLSAQTIIAATADPVKSLRTE